jgi:hypothetical protein
VGRGFYRFAGRGSPGKANDRNFECGMRREAKQRLIPVAAPLIFDNFRARRIATNIAKLPKLLRFQVLRHTKCKKKAIPTLMPKS